MQIPLFNKIDCEDRTQLKIKFNLFLTEFYCLEKRDLPWRYCDNPYYVLVSEFMLQQTQVNCVIDYFQNFIRIFPDLKTLALSSQEKIIEQWSGLGYNRRAIYLHQAAKFFYFNHQGIIPNDLLELRKVKGIGEYTSKALITFIYNIPTLFIETNIRTVYFILFENFFENIIIEDNEIMLFITQTINEENPREWYYALMDLGSKLKTIYRDKHIRRSKKFTRQSTFKNSVRELRGKILKILIQEKIVTKEKLSVLISDDRLFDCLQQLEKESFLRISENLIQLV